MHENKEDGHRRQGMMDESFRSLCLNVYEQLCSYIIESY